MNNLKLPNPKMMDVAVPANLHIGLSQDDVARHGWAVSARDALSLIGGADVLFVDLREDRERDKHGALPGALHAPYQQLKRELAAGGVLHELAAATGKRLVFYCAFGERSAMAVAAAQRAGFTSACHLHGGLDAWRRWNGPLVH